MNVGFTLAHRCARDDWKWPKYWVIWQEIIWRAAYEDTDNMKRGDVEFTQREIAKATEEPRGKVRYCVERCFREGELEEIYNPANNPANNPGSNPGPTRARIRNYEKYNPRNGVPNPANNPANNPKNNPSLNNKKRSTKKKNKNPRSDERAPSDHQRIFNFFVQERRRVIGVDDWSPTNGAMMGKNIKTLLRQYGVDRTLQMLTNYFADHKQSSKSWSWNWFFNDPVQWDHSQIQTGMEKWLERED